MSQPPAQKAIVLRMAKLAGASAYGQPLRCPKCRAPYGTRARHPEDGTVALLIRPNGEMFRAEQRAYEDPWAREFEEPLLHDVWCLKQADWVHGNEAQCRKGHHVAASVVAAALRGQSATRAQRPG